MRFTIVSASLALVVAVPAVAQSPAASVLERPPNLTGGWLSPPGVLQFNFNHRFRVGDAPDRRVTNSPTFVFAYRPGWPVMFGVTYATGSFVVPTEPKPNELELFARAAPLREAGGAPLDVSLQLGFNQAAQSVDGEIQVGRRAGPLRLFAAGRVLSNGYASDTTRYAVGGGAVLRLGRHVALAGDVTTLLERRDDEEVAWGAALQLAIPYSPHTFSLQVTNVGTSTLQGSARTLSLFSVRRVGFEFTIPITLSRYFGGRRTTAQNGAAGATPGTGVVAASIAQMAFPARITVAAGATVAWTNNDVVEHTVTADDGSWDSGLIQPGQTWRRTFERPGDYAYHCTPHPFMRGVVTVR